MPGVSVDKDFQAEDDLRTLIEAEKIKRDKSRLKAAMAKGNEKRKDLAKVMKKGKEA